MLLGISGANRLIDQLEDDAARLGRGGESPAADVPADDLEDLDGEDIAAATPGAWQADRPMHPRLAALLGRGTDRRRIQRFLSRNMLPLVEPEALTFLFLGEADAVYFRHFMNGIPNGVAFERLPGTALWHLRLALPEATRFEYKLDVVRNGHGAWINDPHNPRTATDPFGANSVGYSFGYAPPAWTRPEPEAPGGRIEDFAVESRAFGETRPMRVYLPAGYAEDRAYPLVILHDGEDFAAHADLAPVLDNLIRERRVPPFVAALSQPGERNGEYTGDPRHADFLTGEALPALRERFALRRDAAGTVLMGASLGAVASMATAHRHPGVYGALGLKSGSFIFDRGLLKTRDPLFLRIADFVDRLWETPDRVPGRVFVGCGIHEGLIGQNRVLAGFLRDRGTALRFVETRDAHHWQNWRDQLGDSLGWTLPHGG